MSSVACQRYPQHSRIFSTSNQHYFTVAHLENVKEPRGPWQDCQIGQKKCQLGNFWQLL